MQRKTALSDGEWKLMKLLWEASPRTIADMVRALTGDTGWNKNTVFIMLSRMAAKGAVRVEEGGRAKLYYPELKQTDAVLEETESFLDRVYNGSLGLMVASLAERRAFGQEEIDALYQILRDAENKLGGEDNIKKDGGKND